MASEHDRRNQPNADPRSEAAPRRIRDYLHAHREAMVDLLKTLVMLESPSSDQEALHGILKMLEELLTSLGYRVKVLKSGKSGSAGHLYARPRKRQRERGLQMLLGHCDTVWPVGTLETMPLTQDGKTMKGPGVFDMKAGIVQMIYALKAIEICGYRLPLTPILFINSDEEIGSRNATRQIERLAAKVQRVFVLEPALGASGKLKTARKGGASYAIVVKGKAAHAGLNPQDGTSAILAMSYLVQKLFALNDHAKGITVNVGMIEGGVQPNMIAPESSAIVEVRTKTIADWQRIEAAIYDIKPDIDGITLEIKRRGFRPPMEATERNQKLWEQAHEQGRRLGLELEETTAGGGSDGNTTSRFAATLDGLGAVGDGAHAAHEFIELDHWVDRTALLALLLLAPAV